MRARYAADPALGDAVRPDAALSAGRSALAIRWATAARSGRSVRQAPSGGCRDRYLTRAADAEEAHRAEERAVGRGLSHCGEPAVSLPLVDDRGGGALSHMLDAEGIDGELVWAAPWSRSSGTLSSTTSCDRRLEVRFDCNDSTAHSDEARHLLDDRLRRGHVKQDSVDARAIERTISEGQDGGVGLHEQLAHPCGAIRSDASTSMARALSAPTTTAATPVVPCSAVRSSPVPHPTSIKRAAGSWSRNIRYVQRFASVIAPERTRSVCAANASGSSEPSTSLNSRILTANPDRHQGNLFGRPAEPEPIFDRLTRHEVRGTGQSTTCWDSW